MMPILTQPADYRDFPLPDWLFWLYIRCDRFSGCNGIT